MTKYISLLLILSSTVLFAASYQTHQLQHDVPPPVIIGESVTLEVNNLSAAIPVYNATLYFKMTGEADYHSAPMRNDGFIIQSKLNSKQLQPGKMQYYFAFQSADGEAFFLPQVDAGASPMFLTVLPGEAGAEAGEKEIAELLLLSPGDDEVISADEFLIALSMFSEEENSTNFRFKLLIDGVDVSRLLVIDENLFTFAPNTIRSGAHNAEFMVYNTSGKLLAKKTFNFRISATPSSSKGFESRTSFFADNRYQDISENSHNYFRGGLSFDGSYKNLDFRTRVIINSEEDAGRQPLNYYSAQILYNFSPYTKIYLKGGDFSTDYDLLSLWGKRLRGVGAGINLKYFDFDFSYGTSLRAVEGSADSTGNIIRYGTYHK